MPASTLPATPGLANFFSKPEYAFLAVFDGVPASEKHENEEKFMFDPHRSTPLVLQTSVSVPFLLIYMNLTSNNRISGAKDAIRRIRPSAVSATQMLPRALIQVFYSLKVQEVC